MTPALHSFLAATSSHWEPQSYQEAVTIPEWQAAMSEELRALDHTHTWDLVPLPTGKHPISCKWVYKIKTLADGTIDRYKARLVARGFLQQHGIDYDETFAPVAKMTTVRTLLAVASVRSWSISQMDVKNAFLHGDLAEDVYMTPPLGLPHSPGQVCHLRKALYGLKQAPRAWFSRFTTAIHAAGFSTSSYDSALFTHPSGTLLLLYVDDILITGDDSEHIMQVKQHLQMKDRVAPLRYFLGLEVDRSARGYLLSQQKFIGEILDRAALTDTRTSPTPLELNLKLRPDDGESLSDPSRYRQLVGSMVYLTISRPDISQSPKMM